MKLSTHLKGLFEIDPAADAIEFDGRWYSWRELARIIGDINDILDQAGLGPDTGVAVMLRNRPPQLCAALAMLVSERCIVTVNPMQPLERMKQDLRKLRAPAIVAGAEDWDLPDLKEIADEIGCVAIVATAEGAEALPGRDRVEGNDLMDPLPGVAIQMLTSGTTGPPKRIPLERAKFEDALVGAMRLEKGRDPNDPPMLRPGVGMLQNPLSHIGGLFGAVNILLAGRQIALAEKFTVKAWVEGVKKYKLRVAGGPPAALKMILEANIPKEDLSSLVALRTGTAPLAPEIVDEFLERYGLPVLETYGATEFAGGVAGWTMRDFRDHWKDKRGSVGRMNDNVEARVVDVDDFHELASGEIGLLEIRGKQIGDGKSWVRTTDLAHLDEDGFLFIHGRADNAIIRGGFKIMPADVVSVLEDHPAIREASVVGIKDDRLGEVPAAAIIISEGAAKPSEADLTAWVKARMAPYCTPERYVFVEDLPRTPSLKPSIPDVKGLFA